LGVVYVIWGSTYLAIRVAVREGSGFPPFLMAGLRTLVAAAILLGWAGCRRQRVRPHRSELVLLAGSGLLLWVGGNGLVSWSEMRTASGLAALLVAAMPIWAELIALVIDRRPPSWRMAASIVLGFGGVGLLSWPVLRQGARADVLAVAALLLAPLFWAAGSIWLQRRRPDLTVRVISGWQQLLGGVGLLICARLHGESSLQPTADAWLAWAYLVIFGSVVAFTSYMATLRLLPYQIVATYTYANPVIAVLLGWLILHEEVTAWTVAGAVVIVAAIAGVFRNR
jgi:drug/metabolite transporter (DMT)-like permease